MNRWKRLSWLLVVVVLGSGCAGTSKAPETDAETRRELVSRSENKGWIDLETTEDPADRQGRIAEAVSLSRSAAASLFDRPVNRQRPGEVPAAFGSREISTGTDTRGDGRAPDDETSFEFRDVPLKEVVYLVAEEQKLNVFVPIEMPERVTASFPAVDARRGLETILKHYGYEWISDGGIWTVRKLTGEPVTTETIAVNSGITIDIDKQIKPLLGSSARVQGDPAGRFLIVTGTSADLAAVHRYLAVVDRRPPQVLIEALLVEVVRRNGSRRGARFQADPVQIGEFDLGANSALNLTPPAGALQNPFTLGIINGSGALNALLAMDDSISKLNVLHNPFAATVSGKKATLRVIETIPYTQATTNIEAGEGSPNVTAIEQIQFKETGVLLDVTPNVGSDDIIEVLVKPSVQELVGFVQGVPVIDTRESENTVMVRNNETLVIGGLLRTVRREDETRVPVLGEIPLIGEFFRRRETSDERVELMIFVTPRIMGYGLEERSGFQAQDHFLERSDRFDGVKGDLLK